MPADIDDLFCDQDPDDPSTFPSPFSPGVSGATSSTDMPQGGSIYDQPPPLNLNEKEVHLSV